MATQRKSSAPKTSAELKAQLAKAREQLAALEKRAYAEELGELIRSTSIVADFKAVQARAKGVNPLAILHAVATEVGIARLTITQADPPKRAPRTIKKKVQGA